MSPIIENLPETKTTQSTSSNSSYEMEMGQLLFANGNFKKSLPQLKKAMQIYLEKKDFVNYFSSYQMVIQALNELMEINEAKKIHQEVKQVCKDHNIPMNHRVLTYSAYYNIYIEKDLDKAKEQLNTALKMTFDIYDDYIKSGDRLKQNATQFDIMVCLFVYSTYYYEIEDYKNCYQEIKNLKILLKDYLKLKEELEIKNTQTDNVQELQNYHNILENLKKNFPNLQRMQLCLKYMEALVEARNTENYKLADKLLWETYEEANNTNNTFLIPYILCSMAWCYIKLENKKEAQMFFNLAKKNLKPECKLLATYMETFDKSAQWNQVSEDEAYDLIFDIKDHLIVEKQKGCIELKNQFILMDLLKLFLLNPGVSYSKEKIIQQIWKQDYLPEVHDNKIYVTIKRLREMIELNSCKPYYIRRNNTGYHFSKQAKVLVKQ